PHCPVPSPSSALSLHDALPISNRSSGFKQPHLYPRRQTHLPFRNNHFARLEAIANHSLLTRFWSLIVSQHLNWTHRNRFVALVQDRKSTRLNSSHRTISYAVFC